MRRLRDDFLNSPVALPPSPNSSRKVSPPPKSQSPSPKPSPSPIQHSAPDPEIETPKRANVRRAACTLVLSGPESCIHSRRKPFLRRWLLRKWATRRPQSPKFIELDLVSHLRVAPKNALEGKAYGQPRLETCSRPVAHLVKVRLQVSIL